MTALDLYTTYFDGKHFVDGTAQDYYKVNNPQIFGDARLKEWDETWAKLHDMLNLIDVEYVDHPVDDDEIVYNEENNVTVEDAFNADQFAMLALRLAEAEAAQAALDNKQQ